MLSRYRQWRWRRDSARKMAQMKEELDVYLLNLGCGPNSRDGWFNLDMAQNRDNLFWDSRDGLPFNDGSVDVIFMEHMFEHLDYDLEALPLLRECRRCLKPGGVLRIIVPDAGRYLKMYGGPWEALAETRPLEWTDDGWRDIWLKQIYKTQMQLINAVFHQKGQHKYAYDAETLILAIREAGFDSIEEKSYGETILRFELPEREDRSPESLYVEAIA